MLHEYDDTLHHPKTTLDTAPTLLVLHEISAYFTEQASEATLVWVLRLRPTLSLTGTFAAGSPHICPSFLQHWLFQRRGHLVGMVVYEPVKDPD